MQTQGQALTATGQSSPLMMYARPGPLPPAVIVNLSSGASMTYNIEVTGIGNPSNANGEPWNIADGGSALTASINLTLTGCVIAVRARITAYSSGTLDIRLVQP